MEACRCFLYMHALPLAASACVCRIASHHIFMAQVCNMTCRVELKAVQQMLPFCRPRRLPWQRTAIGHWNSGTVS